MENKKYGSKLYKPNKPLHSMSIEELCNHNLVCRSLDKMKYEKIKRLERLSDESINRKIKRFLERNSNKKTRKNLMIRKKTKKLKKRGGRTRKINIKKNKKSLKSKEIL